jgi:hypothetical protein
MLQDTYSSPDTIRVIKSWKMRGAEDVAGQNFIQDSDQKL